MSTQTEPEAAKEADPGQTIAEAIKELVRQETGSHRRRKRVKKEEEGFGWLAVVTLVIVALDLAMLAVVLEPLRQAEVVKVAQNLLVWVLGGAVVTWRTKLRAALLAVGRSRWTLVWAVPIAAGLGIGAFGKLPVPMRTNGSAVMLDDTLALPAGQPTGTLWARASRRHQLRVVAAGKGADSAQARLTLGRRDLLKGAALWAIGALPGVRPRQMDVAPLYWMSTFRAKGKASLQLEGDFPPLLVRVLRGANVAVDRGPDDKQVATWSLDSARLGEDLQLPAGRFAARLVRDTCVQRIQEHYIGPDSTLDFRLVPCTR